jgi:hypothetical protein
MMLQPAADSVHLLEFDRDTVAAADGCFTEEAAGLRIRGTHCVVLHLSLCNWCSRLNSGAVGLEIMMTYEHLE